MTRVGEKRMLSVALPVYNGANYLREALESILEQDFQDFELVVSDNSSTDETPAILDEYRNRDSRIRVSRSKVVLSQADNCNRAVDLCAGEWVKLFCHDDLMRSDCLSKLTRAINEVGDDSVGVIGNGEAWLFANGYVYGTASGRHAEFECYAGRDFIKRMLEGAGRVPLPSITTAAVRKAAWDSSSKFDRRFVHFDVFLWTRMLTRWDYLFLPEALTTNRIHGSQVAVSARKSLRSVSDTHAFYTEFLNEFGGELELGIGGRMKTRLRWVAAAGTTIAIELLKRNLLDAVRLTTKVPARCWPILPMLVTRSWFRERRRVAALGGHVPVELVYPD